MNWLYVLYQYTDIKFKNIEALKEKSNTNDVVEFIVNNI